MPCVPRQVGVLLLVTHQTIVDENAGEQAATTIAQRGEIGLG